MRIRDVAVVRGGDKGDDCHLAVVPVDREAYERLWLLLTPEFLTDHFGDEVAGPIDRFQLPNIECINIVLHGCLGGGAARGWQFDRRGAFAEHLMDAELSVD